MQKSPEQRQPKPQDASIMMPMGAADSPTSTVVPSEATKPIIPPPALVVDRLVARKRIVENARDQLRQQLNGLENQLLIINDMLSPEEPPDVPPSPEMEEGPTLEHGKI